MLFTGTAAAFKPARPPAPPPQRPPQIWIDPALKLEPVRLQDVAIDIRIQGFVASTRLDLTFHNPNPRVLESELVFPLAEGQSITGHALEVAGQLREGVVVEKETARVAYEATVRRGIDDIDLWVVDPLGEIAIYRNARGGHLSRDFTGGYGPEVFTIRRPIRAPTWSRRTISPATRRRCSARSPCSWSS